MDGCIIPPPSNTTQWNVALLDQWEMYKFLFQFKAGFNGGEQVAIETWWKAVNPVTASEMTSQTLKTYQQFSERLRTATHSVIQCDYS